MTKQIQSREKADKLARAICADIALYNRAALLTDPTSKAVQDALREGMLLYRSRVSSLEEVFLAAADELLLSQLEAQQRDILRAVLHAERDAPPAPAPAEEKPPKRRDSEDRASIVMVGLLLVAVATAAVLLLK